MGIGIGRGVLSFVFVALLTISAVGYQYFQEMQKLQLQAQTEAQVLSTQAIAKVLDERSDLFFYSSELDPDLLQQSSLNVYHLNGPIQLDGDVKDWALSSKFLRHYSKESVLYEAESQPSLPLSFDLLLGERSDSVYGYINVYDDQIIFRDHTKYRRLDNSDHIRLIIKKNNTLTRYVLLASQAGTMTAYAVHENWQHTLTGEPEYNIKAFMRPTPEGYSVEFKMPYHWVGEAHRLVLMVADVDDIKYRRVKTTVATLPSKWSGKLNQLIILSYPLQNILTGLERLEATDICVVDKYRRVRTATASALDSGRICDKSNANSEQLINAVLNGQSQLEIYSQQSEQGNQTKIIVTAEPVYLNKAVIGAVLLEKNSQDIFQAQRKTIDQLGAIALVVFLIIAAFLLRLSYRIMRFNNELNYAINSEGRLVTTEIQSEKTANDNLGDLSRSVSALLLQLKRYTHFLETIPRILRHEILNPVNAISLGVQQLQSSSVITKGSVQKIQTSVAQLELIVSRLTEAAHIEEALITDSFETIDLISLINEYVENIQMLHPKSKFNFIRPKGRVSAKMSPLRFVQMLDKIKDNAVQFTKDTGSITFAIAVHHQQIQLLISNDGPLIPKEVLSTLLMGMFTSKTSRYDQPHLGIGLYIARHIADSHQAHIQINNRDDGSGVEVLIKIGIAT